MFVFSPGLTGGCTVRIAATATAAATATVMTHGKYK